MTKQKVWRVINSCSFQDSGDEAEKAGVGDDGERVEEIRGAVRELVRGLVAAATDNSTDKWVLGLLVQDEWVLGLWVLGSG